MISDFAYFFLKDGGWNGSSYASKQSDKVGKLHDESCVKSDVE